VHYQQKNNDILLETCNSGLDVTICRTPRIIDDKVTYTHTISLLKQLFQTVFNEKLFLSK